MTDTTQASSITYNGVTFSFDREMQVGTFVDGRPFVISDQAFEITEILPVSVAANGGVKNGTMADPYFGDVETQGFDEFIATSDKSGKVTYDSALNIDPGNTGSNIQIAAGTVTSIVKSRRRATVTDADSWTICDRYIPLTVLDTAPPAGAFCPSMSALQKRFYTLADLDLSVFRSLSFPSTWTDSLSSIELNLPQDLGAFGAGAENARRLRQDGVSSNYSASLASRYAKACIILHSGVFSASAKQNLLYKILVWGIQLEGLYDRGWRAGGGISSGAGQQFCHDPIFYTTAFAFRSATMLDKARGKNTQLDNAFWITEENYTTYALDSDSSNTGLGFSEDHIGMPHWSASADIGPHPTQRYSGPSLIGLHWEAPAIFLLQNGPSGETGFSARNNGSYGTTNNRSAIWALLDRVNGISPWPNANTALSDQAWDLWTQTCRGLNLYTAWSGKTTGPHVGSEVGNGDDGDLFTAINGGYSWDVSAYTYNTEPITGRRLGYSLDGTQPIFDETVSDNGSVTGLLPGTTHYLSWQWESASGWSERIPNFKYRGGSAPVPHVFPTLGTAPTGVPSFTVAPKICQMRNQFWRDNAGNWEVAPSALDRDKIFLKAGLGYTDNTPASWVFQWRFNGQDITIANGFSLDATSQNLTVTDEFADGTLTCFVTPRNASNTGNGQETTGVAVSAAASIPDTVLMDTDFRGRAAIDYGPQIAGVVADSCEVSISPDAYFILPNANGYITSPLSRGALFGDKTGSFPSFFLPLRTAKPSTTYNVSGHALIMGPSNDTYRAAVREGPSKSAQLLFGEEIVGREEQSDTQTIYGGTDRYFGIIYFSGQFTTGTDVDLFFSVESEGVTSGGSGSGFDAFLMRLDVQEA
ncbi:MAG: hypothetical protein AAF762_00150 [Pseudomonadota bacterium]